MELEGGTNERKMVYGVRKDAGTERALAPGEWNPPLDRGEWAEPANGRRTRIERAPGWDAPGVRTVDLLVGKEAFERATQVEMSKEATLRKKEAAMNIRKEKRAGSKRGIELGDWKGRGEAMIQAEELQRVKRRRMEERANIMDWRTSSGNRDPSRDSGVEVGAGGKRSRMNPQRRRKMEEEKARGRPAEATSARGGERGQPEAGSQGRGGRPEHGEEERSRATNEERQRKDREDREA